MSARECAPCRLKLRRGRLCPEHFFDMLAWLTATGQESLYWFSHAGGRRQYISDYVAKDAITHEIGDGCRAPHGVARVLV